MRAKGLCYAALIATLAVGAYGFLQQPSQAANRRPLDSAEMERLRASNAATADWRIRALDSVGVSKKLNPQQLQYFRDRGAEETYLLRYLAEFGITPEEAESLDREGVQMVLADPTKIDVFHWAALADKVVVGTVDEVRGNPGGPYHTEVDLLVDRHVKNASGLHNDLVTGVLLHTGPRAHPEAGHLHHVDAPEEPNLKEGERVVVFLSRTPINLVTMLASNLANEGRLPDMVERQYGDLGRLTKVLESPNELEVVLAYKIVGDTAVLKGSAYRVPSPHDVIDLSELISRIERIAAAQAQARAGRNHG